LSAHNEQQILWLKSGPLHPLDTGGKLRTYNMLRVLNRRHAVSYVALCTDASSNRDRTAAVEYSRVQQWVPWKEAPKHSLRFYSELASNQIGSSLPYVISKYASTGMARAIQEADQGGHHDLIVCDFLTPAINLFAGGRRPATRTVVFQHNVEAMIWRRMAEQAPNPFYRYYLMGQWSRMIRYEREICARFGGVIGVSEEDCKVFRSEYGLQNVLGAVPTGVDTSYFQRSTVERVAGSLVFLGSMDWMPNIDAVVYFVDEIWPRLAMGGGNLTFTILGRNPPERIRKLALADPRIRVTGTVEDVRPHLAGAQILVVPLRIGGGTRIKIFEAMATGIPVVSTRIGAEGLDVTDGQDIVLADSPAEFSAATRRLIENPNVAEAIGERAWSLVNRRFGWDQVADVFESLCLRKG
jgi:glycosyltransferase involved in cell wall biosynthesis